MLGNCLRRVRETSPLIHNITNYVTVNGCANILLAAGASPIMADECREAADITSICGGLCVNIGTLNARTIEAMLLSGKRANQLSRPCLLDPVGAGASPLRTDTARTLMKEIQFTVIRGNMSEIKALGLGSGSTRGVDADVADVVSEDTLPAAVDFAKALAKREGAIICITGAIDIVAEETKAYAVKNGTPYLSRITGSGCMLSSLITAFMAANPEEPLHATVAAVCAMGLCGESAEARVQAQAEGTGSFLARLLDAMSLLTGEELEEGARYELFE